MDAPQHPHIDSAGARAGGQSGMRLRNFPCWIMGHMYRHKPGDKEMLVCQRCGHQELWTTKKMHQGL
jgi:hypothetical protein